MTEQLTPLECVEYIRKQAYGNWLDDELDIIETALKDYEHPRKEGFKQDNRLRLAYQEMGRYSLNKETPQELRGKPYGDIIGIVPKDEEGRWDLYLMFNFLLNRPIHDRQWNKDKKCFIEYPCLLQELENRGYDVKTIYFEISKKDRRKKYIPYKTYLHCRENLNLNSKTEQKKLKAFEIIKEKGIDIIEFKRCKKAKTYNENTKRTYCKDYTQEEFDLLKEVLK